MQVWFCHNGVQLQCKCGTATKGAAHNVSVVQPQRVSAHKTELVAQLRINHKACNNNDFQNSHTLKTFKTFSKNTFRLHKNGFQNSHELIILQLDLRVSNKTQWECKFKNATTAQKTNFLIQLLEINRELITGV